MKAFKWMGTAAVAALMLLTSCLGDGDNTMTRRGFGVGSISQTTYRPVVLTAMGAMSSPNLNVVDGGCYVVNYDIDFNAPGNENAAVNGFYEAKITVLDEIAKGHSVFYNKPDTATLLPNELPIKNVSASPDFGVYVGGHLFLFNAVDMVKDQKNDYILYWDRSVEPNREGDVPVYDLFLRASKMSDGTGTTMATTSDVRAFNINDVLNSVNKTEKDKGSKAYTLKVNYLSGINQKDSTDLKWSSFKIPFMVQ